MWSEKVGRSPSTAFAFAVLTSIPPVPTSRGSVVASPPFLHGISFRGCFVPGLVPVGLAAKPMSGKSFFDTALLIYAVASEEPRSAIAERLLAEGGYLSVQVLNEFSAVARRKLKMSWEEITDALLAIRALCALPTPLSITTQEAGLAIAARYGYAIYDALILAAALEAG